MAVANLSSCLSGQQSCNEEQRFSLGFDGYVSAPEDSSRAVVLRATRLRDQGLKFRTSLLLKPTKGVKDQYEHQDGYGAVQLLLLS